VPARLKKACSTISASHLVRVSKTNDGGSGWANLGTNALRFA
jgi:hypothetical protein